MTRPTDAAIARAFWELCDSFEDGHIDQCKLLDIAAGFDAARKADVHTIPEKGTTPPQRVQIQPESERGHCSLCGGNVWIDRHCSGPACPMKPKDASND